VGIMGEVKTMKVSRIGLDEQNGLVLWLPELTISSQNIDNVEYDLELFKRILKQASKK
jgi:hypothetical protein